METKGNATKTIAIVHGNEVTWRTAPPFCEPMRRRFAYATQALQFAKENFDEYRIVNGKV